MRRVTGAAAALALIVLVGACSSSSDDDASAPGTSPPPSSAATAATTADTSPDTTTDTTPTVPATTDPPPTEPSATDAPAATLPATDSSSDYPEQSPDVPYPTLEWPVGDLPEGVDSAVLDAAVATAFGADDAAARVRALVVVKGGEIVYERYHPLDSPDQATSSLSVAKSFTSAIVGMLIGEGRLELDAPAPVEEWQADGDPRREITLEDLHADEQRARVGGGVQPRWAPVPDVRCTPCGRGSDLTGARGRARHGVGVLDRHHRDPRRDRGRRARWRRCPRRPTFTSACSIRSA